MDSVDVVKQHLRSTYEEAPKTILRTLGVENISGKSILDLVCGEMILDFALVGHGAKNVVGVDGVDDRDFVTETAHKLRSNGFEISQDFADRLNYRPFHWSTFPAEAAEFDTIICWGAFHRIPDVAIALQEMNRVLVPEGVAFICVYPWWHSSNGSQLNEYIAEPFFHLRYDAQWIRAQLDEYIIQNPAQAARVDYMWNEFLNLNRISFDDFCNAARKYGFEISSCENFGFPSALSGAPEGISPALMAGGGSNLLLRKRRDVVAAARPTTGYGREPIAPAQFDADGLRTAHNSSFLTEPRFQAAYNFGLQVETSAGQDLHIEWRVRVALWAAEQALLAEGDFVECGVYTGVLAGAICKWVGFENMKERKFWLLDTFEGLPEEQLSESERALNIFNYNLEYRRVGVYDLVREKFSSFPNVEVLQGDVKDTMPRVAARQVAYLSIDMNMTKPEMEAIEYFWPKLAPGGVVVLDDYNQVLHIQQKAAMDEFAKSRGVTILGLPTGQGILIKPARAQ